MTSPLPLVANTDIESRLGETLAGTEIGQVDSLIAFASAKIRALVPGIDARILAETLDADLVKGTLVTAICRALDVLRVGIRVRSEQFPEIQTTYADATPDLVWFSDGELAALSPTAGSTSGAWTIRPGGAG